MIPMRDGILLNTVVLTPLNQNASYPFLIVRTPYGVDGDFPDGNQEITFIKIFTFIIWPVTDIFLFSRIYAGNIKVRVRWKFISH